MASVPKNENPQMKKNIAYYETVTSITAWLVILSFAFFASSCLFVISIKFMNYPAAIATALVIFCAIVTLFGHYTIQIDDTAIAFGYYFIGKEKVLLNTIAYAEIFIVDPKNPTILTYFIIDALRGPPVWVSGAFIRLRLNKEYLTRYKLKQKKKMKQLVLVSRQPESVLSVLSKKGVPVQSRWRSKKDFPQQQKQ